MSHPIGRLDEPTRLALVRFGAVLRELRGQKGWSQRTMAAASGLSQSTISRLESGLAPGVRLAWVARLLAALEEGPYYPGTAPWDRPGPPGWRVLIDRLGRRPGSPFAPGNRPAAPPLERDAYGRILSPHRVPGRRRRRLPTVRDLDRPDPP